MVIHEGVMHTGEKLDVLEVIFSCKTFRFLVLPEYFDLFDGRFKASVRVEGGIRDLASKRGI